MLPIYCRPIEIKSLFGVRNRGRRRDTFFVSLGDSLLLLVSLVQKGHRSSDQCLGTESNSRENEALLEFGRINLRVRQDRDPGIEGIAQRVHDSYDNGTLLGIGAANLVRPAHAEWSVRYGSALEKERKPLQPVWYIPDGEDQGSETTEEGGYRHDAGTMADRVGEDGE